MQIVPVSRRFRQNVLQFVFFFSRSAIKQWSSILIPKNVQTHSKWPRKFPTSFYDNVKKCKIERGFVRLPKMKVSIPNTADTHVYDCNSKCRWKIPPSFSRDSWKLFIMVVIYSLFEKWFWREYLRFWRLCNTDGKIFHRHLKIAAVLNGFALWLAGNFHRRIFISHRLKMTVEVSIDILSYNRTRANLQYLELKPSFLVIWQNLFQSCIFWHYHKTTLEISAVILSAFAHFLESESWIIA